MKCDTIRKYGGGVLLDRTCIFFFNSPCEAIKTIFPEFIWKIPLFSGLKIDSLLSPQDQTNPKRIKFEQLRSTLGIKKIEEWLRVSWEGEITGWAHSLGISSSKDFSQLLREYYPHVKWPQLETPTEIKAAQRRLKKAVLKMFGEKKSCVEDHQIKTDTELDIYMLPFSLALEYQGEQHYLLKRTIYVFKDLGVAERDEMKAHFCNVVGISLIHVPFWWEKERRDYLAGEITNTRPDLSQFFA